MYRMGGRIQLNPIKSTAGTEKSPINTQPITFEQAHLSPVRMLSTHEQEEISFVARVGGLSLIHI